jgi:hypothetical protein
MMQRRRVFIAIVVGFVLFVGLAPALAQQSEYPQSSRQPSVGQPAGTGGMGGMPLPPPGGGICTDGKYLYVLQGVSIHQYTIPDLTLKKTVELPRSSRLNLDKG